MPTSTASRCWYDMLLRSIRKSSCRQSGCECVRASNWVNVEHSRSGYTAQVGEETFDVRIRWRIAMARFSPYKCTTQLCDQSGV